MGFSLSPATQTVAINVAATITISVSPPLAAGQPFSLSDNGGGGAFVPASGPVVLATGVGSTTFTYQNSTPGAYTITVTPTSGGIYPLSGQAAQTVQVVVVSGSPPSATAFSLTPSSNTGTPNQPTGAYILALTNAGSPAVAGVGGQSFALTSNDSGGSFSPGATVTVLQGQSSVSFTYQTPNIGIWTLTATASGSPFIVNTATASAVITMPTGGGGTGGRSMGPLITANGMEFGEAYLYGTKTNTDDTPFAKLQSLDFKIATALKEAMGPEQYSAVAVGIGDRKYTLDFTVETYSLQRYNMMLGGTAAAAQAAITAPSTAPTLTAASGTTPFSAGYVAVGFAYRNKWGATVVSTLQTVLLTSTQKITVTTVALPTGITSLDWFVSSATYATAALALAGSVYLYANNNGVSFDITNYASAQGQTPYGTSQIGPAGYTFAHYAYDEPVPFTVHCVNPADGSQRNLLIYGCVSTDLANSLKLREWTTEKITANVYGNGASPALIFEWFAPGTYRIGA